LVGVAGDPGGEVRVLVVALALDDGHGDVELRLGHGDAHLGRGLPTAGVAHRVGEGVRTALGAGVGRVDDRAALDGRGAVAGTADADQRQRVTVGVGVVGEHV